MKRYSITWKNHQGTWQGEGFEASCDTDARLIAREKYRKINKELGCGLTLTDFFGHYISL